MTVIHSTAVHEHVSAVPGIGQSVPVSGRDDGVIREAVSGKESLCLVVCKGQ